MVPELNERSREVLKLVVEAYVETGEPIGSRTLSRHLGMSISPATIRNVMADLEELGLLYAPHTSAGRLPTEAGLRLFVDGILEVGSLSSDERASISAQCIASGRTFNQVLEEATQLLSGLSHCAGLVVAPKRDTRLKHLEFVRLGPGQALVVLVGDDGLIENRVIDVPPGLPASSLIEATNFLSAHVVGRSLDEAREKVKEEIDSRRREIDELTRKVVDAGFAVYADDRATSQGVLIVRGQAHLLDDVNKVADLERIRHLFGALEKKEAMLRLIDTAAGAEGVQIFIGAENALFSLSGCAAIMAPLQNQEEKIIGAIGVVGPTRMNYARIVPMVDYTARIVGRIVG